MAMFNEDKVIRTGLTALKNTGIKVQTQAAGMRIIRNPVLKYQIGSSFRAAQVLAQPPFDLNRLRNIYLGDGLVRQGIDKYSEIILKEEYWLKGEEDPVRYMKTRLEIMTLQTGEPWKITFERAIRDFIQYGNAFLVKKRTTSSNPIKGLSLRPIDGQNPIGGYYNVPPYQMFPELDENGNIIHWVQKASRNRTATFMPKDVIHMWYSREAGGIWGLPPLVSVVEDTTALRQAEENVLKLIYKHLNPLIVHSIPDVTGTGEGRQEDMDEAVRNYQQMAPDGYIIVTPGTDIKAIGAENAAIRAREYLDYFKQRLYSGLGVSPIVMGEDAGAAGSADALTAQMHYKAKIYQYLLSIWFSTLIFNELLMEAGFNPLSKDQDRVSLVFNEIEVDKQIKEQTHALNLYTMNGISLTELREKCRMDSPANLQDFYSHRIQIPQLIAAKVGMDPTQLDDHDLHTLAMVPTMDTLVSTNATKTSKKTSIVKPKKTAKNIITPANQHTVKPNAPTAHKMSADDDRQIKFIEITKELLDIIPSIRNGELDYLEVREKCFGNMSREHDSYIIPLCKTLIADITNTDQDTSYIRVNARMTNERALILQRI